MPKLNYLLRCMPPQHTDEAARAFDDKTADALLRLLHVRPDASPADAAARQRALAIAHLPMRMGGLGLPLQQHIRLFAHAGTVAQVAHLLAQPDLQQRALASQQLIEAVRLIEAAVAPLDGLAGRVPAAPGVQQFLTHYGQHARAPRERGGHPADRLQHHLSRAHHQGQRDALMRGLVPAHAAVLQSAAGTYGGACSPPCPPPS